MKIDPRPSKVVLLLTLWSLWLCTYCHAQLSPQPRFLWSLNLDDTNQSHSLKKGNGVVASQDGVHIVATTSNGSLHIVRRSNLCLLETTIFRPPIATGSIFQCSSKPVLVHDGTSNAYVVYSVVKGNESAVFGVNFDGSLKWQVIVDGQIIGTPAVSNKAIYISHNVDSTTGYLSVLLFDSEQNDDRAGVPVLTATLAPTQGNAPLGPPSLDLESGHDIVAVAEWWDQGYGSKGNLYLLVYSEEYNRFSGRGNESYTMQHISSWPFSASARPLVVDSSIWLGASGANIGGWQQKDISKVLTGERENVNPKWDLQLDTKTSDAGQRRFPFFIPCFQVAVCHLHFL
ncbi:unnamed protein product [Cylindrotheca closterium]|uniref:Uncharacterized protein n=1 Tax=Cylindrotheca closterium TaxID=2856 RepID=A0AAD2GDK2_9STRA|nr:unnamed protein product [Cylindrotheca closterium]